MVRGYTQNIRQTHRPGDNAPGRVPLSSTFLFWSRSLVRSGPRFSCGDVRYGAIELTNISSDGFDRILLDPGRRCGRDERVVPGQPRGKMWFDGSQTAMRDFARAQDTWAPTWPDSADDRALRV